MLALLYGAIQAQTTFKAPPKSNQTIQIVYEYSNSHIWIDSSNNWGYFSKATKKNHNAESLDSALTKAAKYDVLCKDYTCLLHIARNYFLALQEAYADSAANKIKSSGWCREFKECK